MENNKNIKKKANSSRKLSKKKTNNKKIFKAFTLIELLAVIIILGIIMLIAIPSVTSNIAKSRDKAYIATAKEYLSGARTMINSGDLEVYNPEVTYYIPQSCIKTENNAPSPYGEWVKAYVVFVYNQRGYDYYWTSIDTAKQAIYLTNDNLLSVDKIVRSAKDINTRIAISGHSKLSFLDEETCRIFSDPSNSAYQMPELTSLSLEQYEDANNYIEIYINDKSYSLLKNTSWYGLRSSAQIGNYDSFRINTSFHSFKFVGNNSNVNFCISSSSGRDIAARVYKERYGVTGNLSGGSSITCLHKINNEFGTYNETAVVIYSKSITEGDYSGMTYTCLESILNSSNIVQSIYSKPKADAHYHTNHECDNFTLVDINFTS